MKYNIITLNAGSMLKHYQVKRNAEGKAHISYELDFSKPREKREYIKMTDEYKDTAMFYQIRKVLEKKGQLDWTEDSLKQVILFVDFEMYFNKKDKEDNLEETSRSKYTDDYAEEDLKPCSTKIDNEYRLRSLFEQGIDIKYSDELTVHFIPFDKSNSMARQSKISFIDENLLEDLNPRLNLDFAFKKPVSLSKYYTYRGLYLSTADRVETEEELFDSSKVVIIKDASAILKREQNIITAEKDEGNQRKWKKLLERKQVKIEKIFDGEGIISPSYSAKINEACGYHGATSFQVRMPFIKGMLHQVDFHSFIREVVGDVESLYVKDVFGVKRDLLKAEIVMPESMFKCKKWLEASACSSDKCMDYYFKKFYEYDHALYISNTNLVYGKSTITKLNYQFLNTLALNDDEFEKLMFKHKKWIKDPIEYLQFCDGKHENNENDEDESDADTEYDGEKWRYALSLNPVFSHEYKIRNILTGVSNGLKNDLLRGKILVKGEIRFLSRDLLGFLIELIKEAAPAAKVKELKRQCFFSDEFFMPGSKLGLEMARHYPIFRNPHLSRNEQCVLKPYLKGKQKAKDDLYYRYFSHLTGVVMVGYKSLVPQALGGADFDGDIVKIVDDKLVRNAVLREVYDKYERKLPIIEIPSVDSKVDNVTDKVSFDVIKNTFSNQIGKISNLSILLGSREYGGKGEMKHSCAECTILTGLEIDAAKSGEHPDLEDIIKYKNSIENSFNYVKFKNDIGEIRNNQGFEITRNQVEGDRNNYKIQDIYDSSHIVEYEYNDLYSNLEGLPRYYYDVLFDKPKLPGTDQKVSGKYRYFDFLENNEWKKSIDTDLQKKISAVMATYYQIKKIASRLFKLRQRAKTNYGGYIHTILDMQYDDAADDELSKVWEYVDACFDSREQVEKAMEVVRKSNWPFLLPSQKRAVLKNVLNITVEDDIAEIFSNFNARGYQLLFYVLKDVWGSKVDEMTDGKILEKMRENESGPEGKKIDSDFYKQLYNKYIIWCNEHVANWKRKLLDECSCEIEKLLEGKTDDQKLYLLYSLRGSNSPDKDSEFFWHSVAKVSIDEHAIKKE